MSWAIFYKIKNPSVYFLFVLDLNLCWVKNSVCWLFAYHGIADSYCTVVIWFSTGLHSQEQGMTVRCSMVQWLALLTYNQLLSAVNSTLSPVLKLGWLQFLQLSCKWSSKNPFNFYFRNFITLVNIFTI